VLTNMPRSGRSLFSASCVAGLQILPSLAGRNACHHHDVTDVILPPTITR
jgi:hypothetical protein